MYAKAVDQLCIANLQCKALGDCKGIGGLSGAEQLKFKTTGVHVHGIGDYYLCVSDPTLPSNANLNLECLHQTLLDLQRRVQLAEGDPNKLPCFPHEETSPRSSMRVAWAEGPSRLHLQPRFRVSQDVV